MTLFGESPKVTFKKCVEVEFGDFKVGRDGEGRKYLFCRRDGLDYGTIFLTKSCINDLIKALQAFEKALENGGVA